MKNRETRRADEGGVADAAVDDGADATAPARAGAPQLAPDARVVSPLVSYTATTPGVNWSITRGPMRFVMSRVEVRPAHDREGGAGDLHRVVQRPEVGCDVLVAKLVVVEHVAHRRHVEC